MIFGSLPFILCALATPAIILQWMLEVELTNDAPHYLFHRTSQVTQLSGLDSLEVVPRKWNVYGLSSY